MSAVTIEPAWADDTTALSAVWARANESVEWIASATAVFVAGLASLLEIPEWLYIRGSDNAVLPWPSTVDEQRQLVTQSRVVVEDRVLQGAGYDLALYGGEVSGPCASIAAGARTTSGPIPSHSAGLTFSKRLSPYSPPRAVLDDLVELAIRAWDPAVVKFTSQTAHMEGRRTGWDVPTGYRVWINDETGSFSTVPDGLSTRRLANGTLLTTPDDWSPYDMVEAVVAALETNGIEEIPH